MIFWGAPSPRAGLGALPTEVPGTATGCKRVLCRLALCRAATQMWGKFLPHGRACAPRCVSGVVLLLVLCFLRVCVCSFPYVGIDILGVVKDLINYKLFCQVNSLQGLCLPTEKRCFIYVYTPKWNMVPWNALEDHVALHPDVFFPLAC